MIRPPRRQRRQNARRRAAVLVLAASMLGLAACGQRGPLTLPKPIDTSGIAPDGGADPSREPARR